MTDISNVVSVSTVVQDKSASRASFGTIGIFCYHALGPSVRTYATNPAGLAEMITDGFTAGHDAYMKMSAIARQAIKPPTVKIFRRTAANVQSVNIIPLKTTIGYVYDFDVVGPDGVRTTVTYTVVTGTANAISTALQPHIDAAAGITAADSTGSVTITPTTANTRFFLDTEPGDFTVLDASSDAGIATALAAGQALDPDFYGVLTDGYSDAELNAAAAWCEANEKLFIGFSNDTIVMSSSTTDVGSDFEGAAYARCGLLWSAHQSQQMAAAMMGRQFAMLPGSSDWNNKALSGTADNITDTQLGHAVNKNVSLFLSIAGLNVTHNAKTSSGRLYDTTRDIDWFDANLAADLFTTLVNNEKLPYDARGKGVVKASADNRGRIAMEADVFTPGTFRSVFPVDGADDPADKAAQLLRFSWSAQKSIGIAKIAVSGIVTV